VFDLSIFQHCISNKFQKQSRFENSNNFQTYTVHLTRMTMMMIIIVIIIIIIIMHGMQ